MRLRVLSGLASDLVMCEWEQAISTTGHRDKESEDKRRKTEALIGRDGSGKTLAAENGEDHAAQRGEEKLRDCYSRRGKRAKLKVRPERGKEEKKPQPEEEEREQPQWNCASPALESVRLRTQEICYWVHGYLRGRRGPIDAARHQTRRHLRHYGSSFPFGRSYLALKLIDEGAAPQVFDRLTLHCSARRGHRPA